jgi:uncharacterized protein
MPGRRSHAATSDSYGNAMRLARNPAGRIGLVTGGAFGTYARIGADMASVLDDGEQQRIVPQQGHGSVQNLADLLLMKGVDLAIVQADVLQRVRRDHVIASDSAIQYITKLYNEEVHILARGDIRSLKDLAGQTVNIDVPGSGTSETVPVLFHRFGIAVKPAEDDQLAALMRLRRGEIAAMAYVVGKPAPLFAELPRTDGLHFLSLPLNARLVQDYLPSRLTFTQYPVLVEEHLPVDTVAVGSVLVTLAASQGAERAHRVSRMVDTLFTRFGQLPGADHHPKWQEVSLRADVDGYTRFPAAQAQLDRPSTKKPDDAREAFDAFLSRSGDGASGLDDSRKEALFRDFLQWRNKQASRP